MERILLRGNILPSATDKPIFDGGILFGADGKVEALDNWSVMYDGYSGQAKMDESYRRKWIAPGLIDAHVHLTSPGDGRLTHDVYTESTQEELFQLAKDNAWRALTKGVTTLRDCGGNTRIILRLKKWLSEDDSRGSRVFVSGSPLTPIRGHLHYMGGEVESAEEIARFVAVLLEQGVDFIKMIGSGGGTPGAEGQLTTFPVERIIEARDAAHQAGTHLSLHVTNRTATRRGIEAGVDTLEHAATFEKGDYRFDAHLAEQMASRGIVAGLTLQTNLGIIRKFEVKKEEQGLTEQEAQDLIKRHRILAVKLEHCRLLHENGVAITCGADAGWQINLFGDLVDGLELMAASGIRTDQVLRSATEIPAMVLGQDEMLGSLRVGASADAIVSEANPLVDVGHLRNPVAVFFKGRKVTRDEIEAVN